MIMRKQRINGTDYTASALCFGLAQIGAKSSEKDSWRLLDIFHDAGGNFLDTARIYSDWIPGEFGRSERILGEYLHDRKNRDSFIITTKCCHPRIDDPESRITLKSIVEDLEKSLTALKTDRIDFYLFHRDNPSIPVESLLETMENAKQQGKIIHYGVSNWSAGRMIKADQTAKLHNWEGLRINQIMLNAAVFASEPPADKTMYDWSDDFAEYHRQTGMPVMAYSSQAGGFFQKAAAPGKRNDFLESPSFSESNRILAEQFIKYSEKSGIGITQLVLLFLLENKDFQIFPIFAAYNENDLLDILKTMDYSGREIDFDSIFKVPGYTPRVTPVCN